MQPRFFAVVSRIISRVVEDIAGLWKMLVAMTVDRSVTGHSTIGDLWVHASVDGCETGGGQRRPT